jgi:aspartate-semialdehyde dehydrogenase
MKEYNLAIVGSTGAVGEEILKVLEEFNLPLNKIVPMSSARSAGKSILYKDKVLINQELTKSVFKENDINIAIFSAGGSISEKYAKYAVEAGAVVIDNTSHFRMDSDVPLVVPEINVDNIRLYRQRGIIANPNCSTIQMVHILKPLDDVFNIKRVDISTYQAVSGAGREAIKELMNQIKDLFKISKIVHKEDKSIFPHQIALNCIPQVDVFESNGYTKEEMKLVNETQKILNKKIEVSATCVRVPVVRGHSEAVSVQFEKDVDLDKVFSVLEEYDHIFIYDDIDHLEYPTPIASEHKNETFIGRIRKDLYNDKILHFWVVADNLRVGAATNSVRIVREFINMNLGD